MFAAPLMPPTVPPAAAQRSPRTGSAGWVDLEEAVGLALVDTAALEISALELCSGSALERAALDPADGTDRTLVTRQGILPFRMPFPRDDRADTNAPVPRD